jgi:GAF domain-containing protein
VAIDDVKLREMVDRMSAVDWTEHDMTAGLRAMVDNTGLFFEGVEGAGLMIIGVHGLQAAMASDEPGRLLEVAQERLGEGPCVDSLTYGEVVHTSDLATDERYTKLGPEVVPMGVRAVLGMPIHIGGVAGATLNIYASSPRVWQEDESRALHALAEVTGSILTSAVLAHDRHVIAQQLEYALVNRVKIERATGVTMARHGLDAVTAFNLLRDRARSSRRKVAEIADEVLAEYGGG